VGTTGLIFAAIAVAWLAYLVPHFVRRRDDEQVDQADPSDRFSDSIRIVEHGTAPLLDQDLGEIGSYEVSTPLTRRAAINELRRLERQAAVRRRRVLLGLLALTSALVGLWAVELVPWWAAAAAGGLVVAFFVVSRISVLAMRRSLDRRLAEIRQGCGEVTVFLNRASVQAEVEKEPTIGLAALVKDNRDSRLWDPVPITMPTYVSKPLAPRTVRTIDLSGPPLAPTAVQPPVTADAPAPAAESEPAAPTAQDHGANGLRESAAG
jgi:hypothetical protein